MAEAERFGEWLQLTRKAHDLTQERLADRIGCSNETIRKIEKDRRRPSTQIAELLADEFNVTQEDRPALMRLARQMLETEEPELPNLAGPYATESAPAPPRHPTNLPSPTGSPVT